MSLKHLAAIAISAALTGPIWAAEEVNVYSYRQEGLIKPFFDRFTAATGIKVNLVTGSADALLTRLESEGRNSPADILVTVDAGRLHRAKAAGVLQSIQSSVLEAAIPAQLRDSDNQWFGLSKRARVMVYNKSKLKPAELPDYAGLTDTKWKGRICIRSSGNIYNQSLLAGMIAKQGEAAAESWAKGMVANFARPPKGNDRAQIKAVAAGQCDIAIVNNYYLGVMQTSTADDGQKEAAAAVGLFYPGQKSSGAHVNVSGAGVTKYAKNKANAIKLLEFLVSDAEQANYAKENHEYPVKPGVDVSDVIKSWGGYPFKAEDVEMSKLGVHNATAVKIFDRVGWQ